LLALTPAPGDEEIARSVGAGGSTVRADLVLLSQNAAAFIERNHIFEKTRFSARRLRFGRHLATNLSMDARNWAAAAEEVVGVRTTSKIATA
jgi:hypothetical protein